MQLSYYKMSKSCGAGNFFKPLHLQVFSYIESSSLNLCNFVRMHRTKHEKFLSGLFHLRSKGAEWKIPLTPFPRIFLLTAKQGDNALSSIRPSASALTAESRAIHFVCVVVFYRHRGPKTPPPPSRKF